MRIVTLCCILLHINAEMTEDSNEKRIKVWEDIVQHADLDGEEHKFPLFIEDNIDYLDPDNVKFTEDNVTEETIDQGTQKFESDRHELNEKSNNSIINFFHKITMNNVTRQGVTTFPTSSLVPLLKTALGSLSGESLSILALGGLLPLLMMSLPFIVMAIVIPVVFIIVSTVLGAIASTMMCVPLVIFASGLLSITDSNFLDKISTFNGFHDKVSTFDDFHDKMLIFHDFPEAMATFGDLHDEMTTFHDFQYKTPTFNEFSSFEKIPIMKVIKKLEEIFNIDMEKNVDTGEESLFKLNNSNVPRFLY